MLIVIHTARTVDPVTRYTGDVVIHAAWTADPVTCYTGDVVIHADWTADPVSRYAGDVVIHTVWTACPVTRYAGDVVIHAAWTADPVSRYAGDVVIHTVWTPADPVTRYAGDTHSDQDQILDLFHLVTQPGLEPRTFCIDSHMLYLWLHSHQISLQNSSMHKCIFSYYKLSVNKVHYEFIMLNLIH